MLLLENVGLRHVPAGTFCANALLIPNGFFLMVKRLNGFEFFYFFWLQFKGTILINIVIKGKRKSSLLRAKCVMLDRLQSVTTGQGQRRGVTVRLLHLHAHCRWTRCELLFVALEL